MKKTYITTMPDNVGAFLRASKVIASYGGNITRVSYNRAVDAHMLFIEVEAPEQALSSITDELTFMGYLTDHNVENRPILISLHLKDEPGTVLKVLEVIDRFQLNISYMSSEADGSGWQNYKLAMVIDDTRIMKRMLDAVSAICDVSILNYDPTEKLLDNTVFYISFSNEMSELLSLNREQTNEFIVNSNKIMQMLDERGEAPFKTFEYIRRFTVFINEHKGSGYNATVKSLKLTGGQTMLLIEPPCGSNTIAIVGSDSILLVDGGFTCYQSELLQLLKAHIPDFDSKQKVLLLTHGDIDHIGIASFCDKILSNESCRENFQLDISGQANYREQNKFNAPYCRLSKLISGYMSVLDPNRITTYGKKTDSELLSHIADIDFDGLKIECYEGGGGHVAGESVYILRNEKIAFTGDDLVNIRGFSKDQAAFNKLAPYLMTSVNVDSSKATAIRNILEKELKGYLICPGHGEWFKL